MRRFLLSLLAFVILPSLAFPQSSKEGIEFFERKIRPVLVEHCYQCHSADAVKNKKLRGGLHLDTRASVLKGGENGPALVPGKPKESLLIKALHYEDGMKMPPKGKLPEAAIADFERWIAMGAPDPRDGKETTVKKMGPTVEAGRDYWAFQPLKTAAPPAVKDKAWLRNPIDAFILAGLEAKGLRPTPTADREKLLRRVYLDLHGIPPTPEEMDAFLKDSSADAYEKLVARLLDSPRFGERWARHWLDVARFAESGGYEFDGDRPGAHLYRDFVIKAFNQDMPFDEFVRLQLAGDRLKPGDFDAQTATGFLVAGPYPGQITAKTRERIRYDHLDDMLATTGSAFLGLSLGCARCHEHKYDPIPQEDYYRLLAALQATDSSKPKLDPTPEETRKAKEAFDSAHAEITSAYQKHLKESWLPRFTAWQEASKKKTSPAWYVLSPIKTASKAPLKKLADGSLLAEGKPAPDEVITITAHSHLKNITSLRLEALTDASLPKNGPGRAADGNFKLSELSLSVVPLVGKAKPAAVKLRPGPVTFEAADARLLGALDADKKTGFAISGETGKDHAAIVNCETPIAGFDGGTVLTITLKFEGGIGALGKMRLSLGTVAPFPALTAKADLQNAWEIAALLKSHGGTVTDQNRDAIAGWHRVFDPELAKHLDAVEEHAALEPKPKLVDGFVAATQGRDQVYFLIRGEVDRKNGLADVGFIQVLMSGPEKEKKWVAEKEKAPVKEPRIALGAWLADTEHGAGHLLARVIVNRLWQHHLGRGIVATPNDFGSQGDLPTHPELLDYLASELIKNGWRLKPIHQMILTSATYRLGNEVDAAAQKADPENKLWWRRAPRRLEAEAIRDSLLAVSGTLDNTMYGAGTLEETTPRRSIYLTVKRSRPIPMLQMFDAPEAIQSIAVRPSTTVATQALALMNSPFVRQRAEKLAAAIRPKTPELLDKAIEDAYRHTLSRRPTDKESEQMLRFVRSQMDSYGKMPRAMDLALTDVCQVLMCANEFVFVD